VREQRLLSCLLASLTIHTAFVAFVPPLLSRPSSSLKRPLWVDLVDLRQMSPPASMPTPSMPAQHTPPADAGKPLAKYTVPARESHQNPAQFRETPAAPIPDPQPLPSARELIPTMNRLLGLQRAQENPLYVEPSGEDGHGLHRAGDYDAYLQEVKETVRQNWTVSGEWENKRGTTVIRISVNQDGSLGAVDLLQSSGTILQDYEALDAIKRSFPFRSPPHSLLDEKGKLSIRFSFHYFLTPAG
jgi:TonB family protein